MRHVLLAILLVTTCLADVTRFAIEKQNNLLLPKTAPATRASRFSPMDARCNRFQGPRLLAGEYSTSSEGVSELVVVDFIVSLKGQVEQPIVVETSNPHIAGKVLESVLSWRYRPATCDGVPIESEGQITLRFSSTTAGTR